MTYLIYCKNVCKYHNVTPPSITIKKTKLFIIFDLLMREL
jgi:hypothetical protein